MPPERTRPVHVVAAVMRDVRGRVLLARRTAGRDLAGAWEFPGGKVEPGETKKQALVRECRGEVGINVAVGDVFTDVTHVYPDLIVHLTLYNARKAEGALQREGTTTCAE